MSRRRAAEKRTILPDHKYKDLVLAKFMNFEITSEWNFGSGYTFLTGALRFLDIII